jgi:hypothetical protein
MKYFVYQISYIRNIQYDVDRIGEVKIFISIKIRK